MKEFKHIFRQKLLLIIIAAGMCMSFIGCDKDPEVVEKPFVRLLENEFVQSSIFNREVNYAVLLPEGYEASEDSFPVVYLLHGFGDNQTAWYKGGLIKYYSDLYASENVPMIFVMPQGFNTYYVNRYTGNLQYMDFFTKELVAQVDSLYRTKKDKSQRAVMGFSMGGYGALILPALNPDIFTISVPLSMSFRTDEQYMAESDGAFDGQWAPIFGGKGLQGEARLTDFFKQNSPFHFFAGGDLSRFEGLKIFIDCGDDEESLSVTSNTLHCLMRDNEIPHEYRVSNGGHSWEYWHNSLHEALHFISLSFQGIEYPDAPMETVTGAPSPTENIEFIAISGTIFKAGVLLPPGYDAVNGNYPVVYLIHDTLLGNRAEQREEIFSLMYNSMVSSKLPKALVIEVPFAVASVTEISMREMITLIDLKYRTIKERNARVLAGNGEGGGLAASIVFSDTSSFASCFLFNAILSAEISASAGSIFYYLDGGDDGQSYQAYQNLYFDLRNKEKGYEYRVRAGKDSYESFVSGLALSIPVLKKRLTATS
jgi:enterochelin esterase-like enzyme